MKGKMIRCEWCGDDPLYQKYHDEEWGVPNYNDQQLFEMLCLEGAQAGLSWITVLNKREHYRKVFDQFDATKVAKYDNKKIAQLLQDPGIIRNKLKVNAFINNAKCYLKIVEKHAAGEGPTFSEYLWSFVDGEPKSNNWKSMQELPVMTVESKAMCKDLQKRGFSFVGGTICYAFMQATGMVNDHVVGCFRHKQE